MFQCLKGGYREHGDEFFARSQMEKARGNDWTEEKIFSR